MDESRTAALGRYGEQLAAEHLTAAGMTVLARNWRCAEGELDLVLRDLARQRRVPRMVTR